MSKVSVVVHCVLCVLVVGVLFVCIARAERSMRLVAKQEWDTPHRLHIFDPTKITFAQIRKRLKTNRMPFIVDFASGPGGWPKYADWDAVCRKIDWANPRWDPFTRRHAHRLLKKHPRFVGVSKDDKKEIDERLVELGLANHPPGEPFFTPSSHHDYISRAQASDMIGDSVYQVLDKCLGMSNQMYYAYKLWFNKRGFTTFLHEDQCSNIVLQVQGHKRWVLISPRYAQECLKQEKPNECGNYFYDVENPYASEEHLKQAGVKWIDFDMRPGMALYVPARYMHFVHSLDDNTMLSFLFSSKHSEAE